jgi:hypothetical protein
MYLSSELAAEVGVAQKSISRHLATLREAGYITTVDKGPNGLLFNIMGYFEPEAQQAFGFIDTGHESATDTPPLPLEAGTKVLPIYAKSTATLPPHPQPTTELLYSTTTTAEIPAPIVDDDALVVVQKLTQGPDGLTATVAADLVRRLPVRCRQQLEYRPFYPANLKNPAGYFRKAIENDYAPPRKFVDQQLRRQNHDSLFELRGELVVDPHAELRAEIANQQLLESLSATERYVLELQVDEKLSGYPWNVASAETKRTVRAGMILEAARQARFGDQGAVA